MATKKTGKKRYVVTFLEDGDTSVIGEANLGDDIDFESMDEVE